MSNSEVSGSLSEGSNQSAAAPGQVGPDPAPSSAAQTSGTPRGGEHPLPAPVPHAGGRYAALRLVTLIAVGAVLYVVGLRGWLLAFAAVLVSGLVSLFLLMKQRNDAAANLERNLEHWKHRHADEDEDTATGEAQA